MSFSFKKMLGSGFPWLFGQDVKDIKRSHFGDEVYKYLHTIPITFNDECGEPIYVFIDPKQIKRLETALDEQLTFTFRLSQSHKAEADPYRRTDPEHPGFVVINVPMGTTASSEPVFGYTFSSINTLEQNQASLEDFVQQQWEQVQLKRGRKE
jgi:hypothetical protein